MGKKLGNSAKLIKSRRTELRMSQEDLAQALGVNRSTISRYESGSIEKMPVDHIARLSKALFTTPDYLMGWTNDPNANTYIYLEKECDPEEYKDVVKLTEAYMKADKKTRKIIRTILDVDKQDK